METTDLPASGTAASEPEHVAATGGGLLLAVFASAIFFSAALLFLVQPMFTKMVLPRFGGAPAVWSVAIVFFQGALLAGYAYAHALTRYAGGTRSVVIHMAVMIAACFSLPLSIAAGWGRPPATGEALWLLGLFTVSIGLPFFALAANSPLLQAWVARTRHPAAKDPVFPLCRQQYRQLSCAAVLSGRHRAVRSARRSDEILVAWILSLDRAHRRLRRAAVAFCRQRRARCGASGARQRRQAGGMPPPG